MEKVIIFDQREIQKKGGVCVKYPVSCLIWNNILADLNVTTIIDCTYGEGRFYGYRKPEILIGIDPLLLKWKVVPDIFINKPVWAVANILNELSITADLVVCDPPFGTIKGGGYNKRKHFGYMFGGPETIIHYSFRLADTVLADYFLLHYKKPIEPENWTEVKRIAFRYFTRFLTQKGEPNHMTYFQLFKRGDS